MHGSSGRLRSSWKAWINAFANSCGQMMLLSVLVGNSGALEEISWRIFFIRGSGIHVVPMHRVADGDHVVDQDLPKSARLKAEGSPFSTCPAGIASRCTSRWD